MTFKAKLFTVVSSTVFAMGAFAASKPAYADEAACKGDDIVCSGSTECKEYCNVKDPKDCIFVCPLTAKAEE